MLLSYCRQCCKEKFLGKLDHMRYIAWRPNLKMSQYYIEGQNKALNSVPHDPCQDASIDAARCLLRAPSTASISLGKEAFTSLGSFKIQRVRWGQSYFSEDGEKLGQREEYHSSPLRHARAESRRGERCDDKTVQLCGLVSSMWCPVLILASWWFSVETVHIRIKSQNGVGERIKLQVAE